MYLVLHVNSSVTRTIDVAVAEGMRHPTAEEEREFREDENYHGFDETRREALPWIDAWINRGCRCVVWATDGTHHHVQETIEEINNHLDAHWVRDP